MTITSNGIGSGLDINSIISQLMATESVPLNRLQAQVKDMQTSISSYGQVASAVSTFETALQQLGTADKWKSYQAASTSNAVATASAASNAIPGSYSVLVNGLANGATLSSATFASGSTAVGTGKLKIVLGTTDPLTHVFTPQAGSNPTAFSVGDGTVAAIRDAVNNSSSGVTASVVDTGSGVKLVFSSNGTGAANSIRIEAQDDDGDNTDAAGLSALAYQSESASGAGQNLTVNQTARDASLSVNGIAITSASNTITNSIQGLTLNLNSISTTPVNISVTADGTTAQASVNSFVSAYNALHNQLVNQTKYVPGAATQAPLQGDSTTTMILRQLQSSITATFGGGSGDFSRLSDIGLALQADGTLALNQTKWNTAAADYSKISRLFTSPGTGGSGITSGFAVRLGNLAASWLAPNGPITSRTDGLNGSIRRNQQSQSDLQSRLDQEQKRLQAQYQAMDSKVATFQSLASSLTQQLAAMTASNTTNK